MEDTIKPDINGFTPMLAACQDNHMDLVKWIFNHGGGVESVTCPDNYGWTPLFVACQGGHLDLVKWLYANGAEEDIRKRTREGETCLEIATFKNLKPVMAWLLEHDGDQIPHEYRYT
jgi:ankyrin repeat protein